MTNSHGIIQCFLTSFLHPNSFPNMQKIISLLFVATLATPIAFSATGDNTTTTSTNLGNTTTNTTTTTPVTTSAVTPVTTTAVPTTTPATTPTTVSTNAASTTPMPTAAINSTLGENKTVSCSSNPAFGANSCDQCFDGGTVTVGKKLTGLFDTWTNNTTGLMIAYQNEQKTPNMIAFGSTKWTATNPDESKLWVNSSDIIWTPTQSGSAKLQYILGSGQKVKFYETDLAAGYSLEKTDRKNGELVGMIKYPTVFHVVDAVGNEGAAKTHNECVAYTLSAPVTAVTTAPTTKPTTPITPAITKTETGPAETIILIVAAFFIAFGLMFSLRKRI